MKGPKNHASSSFLVQVYCQIFSKPNHRAEKCWYLYDYAHTQEEVPQALSVMSVNEVPDPNCYADSGETTHVTTDPGNLVSSIPILVNIKYR